jgi:hypothetical protein
VSRLDSPHARERSGAFHESNDAESRGLSIDARCLLVRSEETTIILRDDGVSGLPDLAAGRPVA